MTGKNIQINGSMHEIVTMTFSNLDLPNDQIAKFGQGIKSIRYSDKVCAKDHAPGSLPKGIGEYTTKTSLSLSIEAASVIKDMRGWSEGEPGQEGKGTGGPGGTAQWEAGAGDPHDDRGGAGRAALAPRRARARARSNARALRARGPSPDLADPHVRLGGDLADLVRPDRQRAAPLRKPEHDFPRGAGKLKTWVGDLNTGNTVRRNTPAPRTDFPAGANVMLITPTLTLQNPSIYGERIPGCICDGCEPIPPARPGRCLAFWGMLDGGWGLLNALDVRLLQDHTPQALQARGACPHCGGALGVGQ